MKGAWFGLGFGLTLLLALFLSMDLVHHDRGSVDFHIYDTYYVISYGSLLLLGLVLPGTFFFIGGLLASRFRSRIFSICSVLSLGACVYLFKGFF